MKRQVIVSVVALAAVVGGGIAARDVGAQGGRIVIDRLGGERHVDPFLDAAEGMVRAQGFRGEFAMLVGLSGLGSEAPMCRQDCDCRETLHSAGRLEKLVAPLRGKVTRWGTGVSLPNAAWDALYAELKADRPLLAEGLTGVSSLHLVVGCDPRERMLIYREGGERREMGFTDWTRGNWSFSTVRLGTTQLPGPKAELEAVTTMFAQARQPRIEGGCAVRGDRTQNAVGLEAYDLWREQLKSKDRPNVEAKAQRVKGWVERREMLGEFLQTAAKHQGGETAKSLREAAGAVKGELKQGLKPLAATTPYPPPKNAETRQNQKAVKERQAGLMGVAASFQRQFLQKIAPIATRRLKLSKDASALVAMKPPKGAPNAAAVRKMLRSKDSRVRTLGALVARRVEDGSMAEELMPGLSSSDPVEARTALDSLEAAPPDGLVGMLQKQVSTMGAVSAGLDGAAGNTDSIQRQVHFVIEDLEKKQPVSFWKNPMAFLTRGPARYVLLGLAVAGLVALAWKFFGPRRLGAGLEELAAPDETRGLPIEEARFEALLARPPATGLLLTHVEPEGMAAKQKLERGDVITRYNKVEIFSMEDLREEILKPGGARRRIRGRRGLRMIKTPVRRGPLGLRGVSVTAWEPFWKRLDVAPFKAEYGGFAEEGEAWYRFTENDRPCGFEVRRWRWLQNEIEITSVTGLMGESGEETVRVTQQLRAGERLTCSATRFRARGRRSVEADAQCIGGRWSLLLNGDTPVNTIPEEALPTQAMAAFAATLPFQSGRAYHVVRVDECDFVPAWGYQMTCAGQEPVKSAGGDEQAWRFNLSEYGVRQMSFWFNHQRQLVRAEYAGLISTLCTKEEAVAGLPDNLRRLADGTRRSSSAVVETETAAASGAPVAGGTMVAER